MSIINDTDNTWKNIDNDSAPTIEEPIERINPIGNALNEIKEPQDTEIDIEFNELIDSFNNGTVHQIADPIETDVEVNDFVDSFNGPTEPVAEPTETLIIVNDSTVSSNETSQPIESDKKESSKRIEDTENNPANNIIQKIKNIPNYLYKNYKCASCSSV